MSLVTPQIRAMASIFHGDVICQEKLKLKLTEMGLPNNLLPVKDIEECGYVKDTGFMWIRQKNPVQYNNQKIGKLSYLATEVTGYMEKFKMKAITGVTGKEFLLWVPLNEVTIDDPLNGNITLWGPSGLHQSFPVSAFETDNDGK